MSYGISEFIDIPYCYHELKSTNYCLNDRTLDKYNMWNSLDQLQIPVPFEVLYLHYDTRKNNEALPHLLWIYIYKEQQSVKEYARQ